MKRSVEILIMLCVFVIRSNLMSVNGTESVTLEPSESLLPLTTLGEAQDTEEATERDEVEKSEQRSINFHHDMDSVGVSNEDRHAAFRKRAKPLKNIFLGIYNNYKSTYLGNKTLTEYRNTLRNRGTIAEKPMTEAAEENNAEFRTESNIEVNEPQTESPVPAQAIEELSIEYQKNSKPTPTAKERISKTKRKKQRIRKHNQRRTKHPNKTEVKSVESEMKETSPIYQYDFGHGYNMSLDMNNDIVNLHLDGESVRGILQGRFLQSSNEGRGKKYEMITRVLPLFIIPFLIQSAVVPFLVTKLKLLLMKSILVGKLAIFLLILSAIKNGNKMMQTYEVAPSYWAGEPSRRSELAAAASGAAYNGYRVEGKPAAWIN